MNTTEPTPSHLLPAACFVCGREKHPAGDPAKYGHTFWSNADARAEFSAADAGRTFVYSNGETTVEGNYVAEVIGR